MDDVIKATPNNRPPSSLLPNSSGKMSDNEMLGVDSLLGADNDRIQ